MRIDRIGPLAKAWVEAMRLRTLPVSVAGVVAAAGYGLLSHGFWLVPWLLCLGFAVLAQVASNFANEYYDFRDGVDRAGRNGPRRGVTEGDIRPGQMLRATLCVLGAACGLGLWLAVYAGWWLIPVGMVVALAVMAYSTGPWPLSRHALGEVAVVAFFGVVPVCCTCRIMSGVWSWEVFMGSLAIGLMGANVLLVNNIRDRGDDARVHKNTLVTYVGPTVASNIYLFNGYIAVGLMSSVWLSLPSWMVVWPALYLLVHTWVWHRLCLARGRGYNPLLGMTAVLMLAYAVSFALCALR